MMRRLSDIYRSAAHACALLGVLLPLAADAVAPRLEVQARIHQADGEVVQRSVAPGAVLRTGDEVRLRATAWADGYLYVVALGSSGSATVLHPFSGPAEPVRTGEELAVPRDGGFLPLDSRTGRENLLAFVSDKPVESLTRLLVRLEAAGAAADGASLREALSSEGFEAAHLAFGHAPAPTSYAPAPAAAPASGAVVAAPETAALAPPQAAGGAEQSEVLSGLGSRIAQFTRRSPAAADARQDAPLPQAETPAPAESTAAQPADQARAPRAADKPSGGILASLFGFGGSAEPAEPAPEPPPPPASTFPLVTPANPQGSTVAQDSSALAPREVVTATQPLPSREPDQGSTSTRSRLDEAPATVPAPSVAAGDANIDSPMPTLATGRFVEPLPMEAGLSPSEDAAERATQPPLTEITPQPGGPVSDTLSRLFGAGGEQRDARVADSARAEPELLPGLTALKTPDARAELGPPPSLQDVPLPPTALPPDTASAIHTDAPVAAASQSAASVSTGETTREVGASPSETVRETRSETIGETPGETAGEGTPKSEGGGLLAGLASLFGARDTRDAQPASVASTDAQQAAQAGPATDTAVTERAVVEIAPMAPTPAPAQAPDEAAPERADAPDAGSGRPASDAQEADAGSVPTARTEVPDAGSEALQSAAVTTEVSGDPAASPADPPHDTELARTAMPATEPAAPTSDPPASDPPQAGAADDSPGFLASLGAFFTGGSRDETPSQAAVVREPPPVRANDGPRLNTGPEPTLSRRVDESGRSVVTLEGAPPPRARNSDVLSESGSRIRALLDEPEPPAAAPAAGVDSRTVDTRIVGEPGTLAEPEQAAMSPSQPAPAPVVADPQAEAIPPVVAAAAEAPPTAAAPSVAAPTVAAPGAPVTAAIAPDPVRSALASGAAAAGSEPPTQVALLTAAPARSVAQAAAQLAQVDLSSNAGTAGAVVMVVTPEGATTGVLVDGRGHVLTNWHSVRGYDAVLVLFKQSGGTGPAVATRSRARLVGHSKFSDLALLQVDELPAGIAPAALVSRVEVGSGEPLHAIGPGADGHWRQVVATVDRIRRNSSWYSTSRVLHRADVIRAEMTDPQDVTGAPLFNNALELVGLGAMVRADKGELIGVSAGTVRAFLAAAGG